MVTRDIKALKIVALIISVMWVVALIINAYERDITEALANIALILSWLLIYALSKNYKHDN